MGAEVEYYASSRDGAFTYVNEYYDRMREVNSILLPCTDVHVALVTLKEIIANMQKKIQNKIGTRGWYNGYGYAYNGVHLHLSGNINAEILETNILRVIGKHGMSPRTVTSWHIFSRPTRYNLKSKRKHRPIHKTNKGTLEIRVLDIEYFTDDAIIKDLAEAISGAYNGNIINGDDTWVRKLLDIPLENYRECCNFLDTNMSKKWGKLEDGVYNLIGTPYTLNFTSLDEWQRDEPLEAPECVPLTAEEIRQRRRMASAAAMEDLIRSISEGRDRDEFETIGREPMPSVHVDELYDTDMTDEEDNGDA
jgi:hypothetical protein